MHALRRFSHGGTLRIFISYSSEQGHLSGRLRLALLASGHQVFRDRESLPPGQHYDQEIREFIQHCRLFIFLVSPETVAPGSYALAELNMAAARWPHPSGHVLPVLVTPIPEIAIPPYLGAVTIFQPTGDAVAETLHEVDKIRRSNWRRFLAPIAVLPVAVALAGGGYLYMVKKEEAQATQLAGVAQKLCDSGDFALAWQRFDEASARYPGRVDLRRQREDCGMLWLREIHVEEGKQTFTEIVNVVLPVLAAGSASADSIRAADLEAHAGWADFLRIREGGIKLNPAQRYSKALEFDPTNVYAHAMWGHWNMAMHGSVDDAQKHFRAALASGRERPYVRGLQLAALLYEPNHATQREIVQVVNEMRLAGENVDRDIKDRLWSHVYFDGLRAGEREGFLSSLPGKGHADTFQWLYPREQVRPDRRKQWSYFLASLEEAEGQREAALLRFVSLRQVLEDERSPGPMLDETIAAIKRLGG